MTTNAYTYTPGLPEDRERDAPTKHVIILIQKVLLFARLRFK